MDAFLLIMSVLLSLAGIVGCIIPALPGHPLNYLAMWLTQWAIVAFSTGTLIAFGVLTVIVLILDYLVPLWSAKKYGATRLGIIGSMAGMIAGMFLSPIGMIVGTIVGAIAGDLLAGKTRKQAVRSGLATFLGTLSGIGMKLLLSLIMTLLVFYKIIIHLIN